MKCAHHDMSMSGQRSPYFQNWLYLQRLLRLLVLTESNKTSSQLNTSSGIFICYLDSLNIARRGDTQNAGELN
jgi:hypothetical protein